MPTPYSHLVQQLLNNYDRNDVRVRTYPYTIDAQLYNLAASALEDLDLRYSREIDARFVETCPINLDNGGVYFSARLPNTFVPPDPGSNPPLNSVSGLRNNSWTTIKPYDDRLPAPSRISIDTDRKLIPFTSSKVFDWISDGSVQYPVQVELTLPIPSALTFWLENVVVPGRVDILVTGIAYPSSAWQKNRTTISETLTYTIEEGLLKTNTVWESVESIVIRNLPEAAQITCWHFPFQLSAVADPSRPYTSPENRDRNYNRYWQIDGTYVKEQFHGGPSVGLNTLTCYSTPEILQDLCIVPRTYAMLAISGSKLYSIDRRRVFPSRLDVTAITTDPLYSIHVVFDPTKTSTTARYVRVQVLQHLDAPSVLSFRYIVEDPENHVYCIDSTGNMIQYSGGAGWSPGSPVEVVFPLNLDGTYVITLECMGEDGNLSVDRFPYLNAPLNQLASVDLAPILPSVQGIGYDSLERLWLWTGDFAVPVKLSYDAYLFDYESNTVYLTESFDQIKVS